MPRPIIEILGIPVDKALLTGASGGDLMLVTTVGDSALIGGAKTGSIFGSGMSTLGYFYPIVLCIISMFVFAIADAQSTRLRTGANEIVPAFNPLAVVTLFSWCFYFTSAATGIEAMSGFALLLLRGWLQVLVIYAATYWGSRAFLKIARNSA